MKTVAEVIRDKQSHWVGDGFHVKSLFSYGSHGLNVSPFLLLDYASPQDFPGDGNKRGVGGHPHKGFETVTIAYQGEVQHRDSHGGGGVIGPGDVQWMTAGAGLLHEEFHSEKFAREGGIFEMVQLWVNLPARHKGESPRYQTLSCADIPVVNLAPGVDMRVIAGDFGGTRGPALTFTPVELWDIKAAAAGSFHVAVPTGHNVLVLVRSGRFTVGGEMLASGDLAIMSRDGNELSLETAEPGQLLIMGGEPIAEPIAGQGPFVMNTQQELQEAFRAFRQGAYGQL